MPDDVTLPPAAPEATAAGEPDPEQPAKQPRSSPRRRWLRRGLLLLGPLVVIVLGVGFYFAGGRYVATENAYVQADKVAISTEVSGPIAEVDVRENAHVDTGDVLFRIDDRPYRIALAEAEAALAAERDRIMALKAEYRQKIEERALIQVDIDYAEREAGRQAKLVERGNVSRSRYDETRHDRDAARRRLAVNAQEMAEIAANLGGDPEAPVEQESGYRQAKAAADRARLDLERTVARAPFSGVASNVPKVGQRVAVGVGAAMALVADTAVWIDANFKETDLTYVRPGQPVRISVDAYPDLALEGRVDSISPATGAEFSVIPPQNATGNWVKVVQRVPVRIAVDAAGGDGPPLTVGMSANVSIDTGHRRSLALLEERAFAKEAPAAARAPR